MCYAVSKFQLQRSISLKSRFAGIFPELFVRPGLSQILDLTVDGRTYNDDGKTSTKICSPHFSHHNHGVHRDQHRAAS